VNESEKVDAGNFIKCAGEETQIDAGDDD